MACNNLAINNLIKKQRNTGVLPSHSAQYADILYVEPACWSDHLQV